MRGAAGDEEGAVLGGGAGQVGREGNGPVPAPVSQGRETLAGDARRREHCAGQHRRHEAARRQRPAQLLDGDRQLAQPASLTAIGLGHVQAEQALGSQRRPERVPVAGSAAVVPVGRRPGSRRRAGALRPGTDGAGEIGVFFSHCEGHRATSSARVPLLGSPAV